MGSSAVGLQRIRQVLLVSLESCVCIRFVGMDSSAATPIALLFRVQTVLLFRVQEFL